MSVKQHMYTDGKEWVGFPLLSHYRFSEKSVSFGCCALANSWLIAECPPHLWVVGHCELTYLQDSITSLRTQHGWQGGSPTSVSPVLLWARPTSHSPLPPTLWKQHRKDAYYPWLLSFPRWGYFYFLHLPRRHFLYLKVNYPQAPSSFKILSFSWGAGGSLHRSSYLSLAMRLEQSR